MKKGDIVKYSKPCDEREAAFRFFLLDDPADSERRAAMVRADCAGGPGRNFPARVSIQLIGDYSIKPIETVAVSEIAPA